MTDLRKEHSRFVLKVEAALAKNPHRSVMLPFHKDNEVALKKGDLTAAQITGAVIDLSATNFAFYPTEDKNIYFRIAATDKDYRQGQDYLELWMRKYLLTQVYDTNELGTVYERSHEFLIYAHFDKEMSPSTFIPQAHKERQLDDFYQSLVSKEDRAKILVHRKAIEEKNKIIEQSQKRLDDFLSGKIQNLTEKAQLQLLDTIDEEKQDITKLENEIAYLTDLGRIIVEKGLSKKYYSLKRELAECLTANLTPLDVFQPKYIDEIILAGHTDYNKLDDRPITTFTLNTLTIEQELAFEKKLKPLKEKRLLLKLKKNKAEKELKDKIRKLSRPYKKKLKSFLAKIEAIEKDLLANKAKLTMGGDDSLKKKSTNLEMEKLRIVSQIKKANKKVAKAVKQAEQTHKAPYENALKALKEHNAPLSKMQSDFFDKKNEYWTVRGDFSNLSGQMWNMTEKLTEDCKDVIDYLVKAEDKHSKNPYLYPNEEFTVLSMLLAHITHPIGKGSFSKEHYNPQILKERAAILDKNLSMNTCHRLLRFFLPKIVNLRSNSAKSFTPNVPKTP